MTTIDTSVTTTALSADGQAGDTVTTTLVPGIELTAMGLRISDERAEVTTTEYHTLFAFALRTSRCANWLLGDVLCLADRQWGNQYTGSKYKEAADATGLAISTIRHIAATCKGIPYERRHRDLSFTHHVEAFAHSGDPEEQERVLEAASRDKLSIKQMRHNIREASTATSLPPDATATITSGCDELGLPERVTPDAPPMWDIRKFHQWIEKTDVDDFDEKRCNRALELLSPILRFHERVQQRLSDLHEGGSRGDE